MTMSVANTAADASPMRGLLPLWVGVGIYALFLLAGNRLLIDPDTMWQITVGQWILDHRAVPETDVYSFTMRGQPWISTQWLAQVVYAKTYALFGWSGPVITAATTPMPSVLSASVATALMAGTFVYASVHRFEPHTRGSPVAAVVALKKLNLARVFNDYDFGGYLIANGVATFIDGRTELYGEKFFVDHNAASGLMEPENLFRLLEEYGIEATLMRTQSAATKLLDHLDGWQKCMPTTSPPSTCASQGRCIAPNRRLIRNRIEFTAHLPHTPPSSPREPNCAPAGMALTFIATIGHLHSSFKRRNAVQES